MINPRRILITGKRLSLFLFFALPLFLRVTLPQSVPDGASAVNQNNRRVTQQSYRPQAASVGDMQRGQDLFMGRLHFTNDGPPCMGCHNIGENGLLGGGAMGPDLTDVSTRRTPTEIVSILSNTGSVLSPVMQPIFTEHPLTESERADLVAFMDASAGQPELNKEILVIGISLAGFVAAVVALGFVYRNRLRGVRKALLRKSQLEKQ